MIRFYSHITYKGSTSDFERILQLVLSREGISYHLEKTKDLLLYTDLTQDQGLYEISRPNILSNFPELTFDITSHAGEGKISICITPNKIQLLLFGAGIFLFLMLLVQLIWHFQGGLGILLTILAMLFFLGISFCVFWYGASVLYSWITGAIYFANEMVPKLRLHL